MPGDNQTEVDVLRIQLTDGNDKLIYDSKKDTNKHVVGFPEKPFKYCGIDGGELQPIVYMCKTCGQRYIQTEDKTSKRIILMTLPEEPQEPQAAP